MGLGAAALMSNGGGIPIPIRIRGIYATALTKVFLEEGFDVVQASEAIQRRFSIDFKPIPSRVTVKSDEKNRDVLLFIGEPESVQAAVRALVRRIGLSYIEESLVEQFSTISVIIEEKNGSECFGAYRGIKVLLDADECLPGKTVPAVVLSPTFSEKEAIRARRGFALHTPLYTLFSWRTLGVSEHVRDAERVNALAEISDLALREGIGIRWSSNAAFIPLRNLESLLLNDIKKLKEIMKYGLYDKDTMISMGRKITRMYLNTHSDLVLDSIRNSVTPTIVGHHTLKKVGKELELLIDFSETSMSRNPALQEAIRTSFEDYVLEKLSSTKKISIRHKKIFGTEYALGPFHLNGIEAGVISLQRRISSRGFYDGLEEKKEPGDVGVTVTSPLSNLVLHFYYSEDMTLKGVYININTPAVFSFDTITYNDLEIDVVYHPDKGASVLERDLMYEVFQRGKIGDEVIRVVEDYAYEVKRRAELYSDELRDPVLFYKKIALQKAQPELLNSYLHRG